MATFTFHISMSSNHNMLRCNEKDREALLTFKKGFIDPFDRLSTWRTEEDCCAWEGVYCNNISGRVTGLDLRPPTPYLEGEEFKRKTLEGDEINFAFLELEFLYTLNLRGNSFDVIRSPPIRHNITHASNLSILDLSFNSDLHMDDFHWLSQLSSLTYLDLSGIDLHKHTNWLHEVTMLPLLSYLGMNECNLRNFMAIPSLKYVNLTSLVTLYLRSNQLKGSIPDWIGQLDHLQVLDLSHNMFSGSIPSSLGNLSSLVYLYIGSNYFSGKISEATLSKLSHLKILDMRNSTPAFRFNPQWVPPFQLTELYLANTNSRFI